MEPLVSILIPAYNAERWIGETLESALGQTWGRKEVLVVDDGSRDGTLAIARGFEGRGVKVLAQPNRGASAARNAALALAQGDYIQWLDADDLLAPDKIARQLRLAREVSSRTLLSGPWAYFYRNPRRARFQPSVLWSDHGPVDWLIQKMAGNVHMQTGTWLTSRALTEAAGRFDERLWRDNDGEYFARVVSASEGIRFVPDATVFYRHVSTGSITDMRGSDRKRESLFLSLQLHIQYLRRLEDSPRVREACVRYLQNWLLDFHPERPDLVEKMRGLARDLGGELTEPRLRPKYDWLRPLVGWGTAKRVAETLPRWRLKLAHWADGFGG